MNRPTSNLLVRLLSLLVLTVAVFLFLTVSSAAATEPITYDEYRVRVGDTLWGIADTISEDDVDLREVVGELREINGLATSSLMAGDVILVPIR